MADTKKLKKTVGKSAVRNTIQISAGDRIYYAIVNVLLGVFTIIVLMPLLNVLASSFSSPEAVNYGWVLFWPVDFSLEGYEAVFEYKGLWQAYGNTFFYAIVGTALNITMTMVCAYPMARKNLPGRKWITWLFMFTMYFGGGTIPNYVLVRSLGMMDTRAAMIIPGAMSVYNMIIARTFINNTPPSWRRPPRWTAARTRASSCRWFCRCPARSSRFCRCTTPWVTGTFTSPRSSI